ncbi:MAG: Hsp20/alpha crystallin family protein [Candidatus Lambdaproteobacteria bacterium]|nr:Hsp20/alpha crystallin family protein [Candidatus Lambdaproteobacteria bacterium]
MTTATQELQKREAYHVDGAERTRPRKVFTPPVDIVETAGAILVRADMPGVNEKTVNVTLEKGVLTIDGTVDWQEPANHDLVYSEFDVATSIARSRCPRPSTRAASRPKSAMGS